MAIRMSLLLGVLCVFNPENMVAQPQIYGDLIICPNTQGTLSTDYIYSYQTFNWWTVGGNIISIPAGPDITISGPGTYCVETFGDTSCVEVKPEIEILSVNPWQNNWCCNNDEPFLLGADVKSNTLSSISYKWQYSSDGIVFSNFTNSICTGGTSSDTLAIICPGYCDFKIRLKAWTNSGCTVFSEALTLDEYAALNITSSTLCPTAPGDCEKACAHSTVTYSVENPEDRPVAWIVNGEESYTQEGNEITVKWGEPGTGSINARILPEGDYFYVDCGQMAPVASNINGGGWAYVQGQSSSPTEVSTNGGISWSPFEFGYFETFHYLPVGQHEFLIRNATGQNQTCSVNMTNDHAAAAWFFLIPPSSCSSNDGQVQVRGFLSAFYNQTPTQAFPGLVSLTHVQTGELVFFDSVIITPSGPTMINITGLIAGDYLANVTFFDTGETVSKSFTLPCLEGCSPQASLCIDIQPEPKALFSTHPAPVNNTIGLCKAQTVQFNNISTSSTSVSWDFGDGTTSALNDPAHTFFEPGIYEVKLIARNDCYCADTTTVTVQVSSAVMPEIQCIGTICNGDSATYRTNVTCGDYHWDVSTNGTVLAGGGHTDDFVTVQWNSGATGTVELSVSGCTGDVCAQPVREEIGIISAQTTIEGPQVFCPGSTAIYSIPDFGGTDILWFVPSLGTIVEGQGTNRITVQWGPGYSGSWLGFIKVEYENCFLGCSGNTTIMVQMKQPTFIEGPIGICTGSNPVFKHKMLNSSLLPTANWQIFDLNDPVVWSSNSPVAQISPNWNFAPGDYWIKAVPTGNAGSCNAETGLKVELLPPLQAPSITGATTICPASFYHYAAQNPLPGATFTWQVKNGNSILQKTGPSINVKWGLTPPYELTLRQSVAGCASAPVTLEISHVQPLSISGPAAICKESSANYSLGFVENINYEWTVEPPQAGVVLAGQGSPDVEIFWQQAGAATLKVAYCDTVAELEVAISPPLQPEVLHPAALCNGSLANVQTAINYAGYQWFDENGNLSGEQATVSLSPGHFSVQVIDTEGCTGRSTFSIAALPSPEVKILSSANCLPAAGSTPLYALETADGYIYKWFHNNSQLAPAGAMPAWFANTPGNYQVTVTAVNGCTATSNVIALNNCSGGNGTGGNGGSTDPNNSDNCTPQDSLNFLTEITGNCNTFQFTNTSANFIPGSLNWNFFHPNGSLIATSTLENPVQSFSEPGFFSVALTGEVPNDPATGGNCIFTVFKTVMVPLSAKFDARETCPGLPVEFTDLSVFLLSNISAWAWDFGDPGSSSNTSTQQHPAHVYDQPGMYTVTLTVTSSTGCKAIFSKNITVADYPQVGFSTPAAYCAASALNFTGSGQNAVTYEWNFGDPGSGGGNVSQKQNTWHAYPETGNYTVTLTAANVYGCTASFTGMAAIEANDLTGSISPDDPAPNCEGIATTFSAPPGGASWLWSNGAASSGITVSSAGIYSVTLTDSKGCKYAPGPVALETIPTPTATIRAVQLNEFGQQVAYFNQSYKSCEGEDVYLQMTGDPKYSYQWSNGSTGEQLSLTSANGNLLPAGTHVFTVTVTDNVSGCTSVEGPFPVTINAAPASVSISSDPAGPICEGTEAVFMVNDPQPGLSYLWNTGQQGVSMDAVAAGTYLVQATNQNGCKAKSNAIEIFNAPLVGSVPAGCFTRCKPAVICLPEMPEVADYQWFLNGETIPAPVGISADLNPSESGDYRMQMTSVYGCISISDVLSITLEDPAGTITGEVWIDLNDNGLIDPADSLISGIGVQLTDGNTVAGTTFSDLSGQFIFGEIPSMNYTVQLDPATLPLTLEPLISTASVSLSGCGDSASVKFLLKNLCFLPIVNHLQLSACEGNSTTYNGTELTSGATQDFIFTSINGCDSVVTVNVTALPLSSSALTLGACPGDSIEVFGEMLAVGTIQDFIFQNQYGCDSVVTVTVDEWEQYFTEIEMTTCPDEPLIINGLAMLPGDHHHFTFQTQHGCDSLVSVTVTAFPVDTVWLDLKVCEGETVTFQGQQLAAGGQASWLGTNTAGCDSLVFASVGEWPPVHFELLADEICPDTNEGLIRVEMLSGAAPFRFALAGDVFQLTPELDGLPGGEHTVVVQDDNGCTVSQTIDIPEKTPLKVRVTDYEMPCDTLSISLRPVVLTHSGELHWRWHDGSEKPWCPVEQAGIYTFRVTDDCATVEQSIRVVWGENLPEDYLYIPNAFSPNGDAVNDTFRAYPAKGVEIPAFEMKIFDRWGNQVFETNDPEQGWDGAFRGRLMPAGVYVWFLKTKVDVCGREVDVFRKGDVTILR